MRSRSAERTRQDSRGLRRVRHTPWHLLEQAHTGRAVPAAIFSKVGGNVQAIEAATFDVIIDLEGLQPDPALRRLRRSLE